MPRSEDATRVSACDLERGLYVVRYLGGGSSATPPTGRVRAAAGSEHSIEIVNAPGLEEGELLTPGSAVVVVSDGPSVLEIVVTAADRAADARFNVELLSRGQIPLRPVQQAPAVGAPAPAAPPPAAPVPSYAPPQRAGADALGLDILAHVSRRGDVRFGAGEWIAGPQSPAPIEGLEIHCGAQTVSFVAQYSNTLQPGRWSDWQPAETFFGTRQKASPLTGVRFRLVGRDAALYSIDADGLFLGSPVISRRGTEVEIKSPGPLDPLVGLRLRMVPVETKETEPTSSGSRVRVFRAGRNMTSAA